MQAHIKIGSQTSLEFGAKLVSVERPNAPIRRLRKEHMDGVLSALEGEMSYDSEYMIRLNFAIKGENKPDVQNKYDSFVDWLYKAEYLSLWHLPEYFFRGYFANCGTLKMRTKTIGEFALEFECNPPCRQRIRNSNFVPAGGPPICEQINAATASHSVTLTAPSTLSLGATRARVETALFCKIEGDFNTLEIGTLKVLERPADGTVYLDGDNKECYCYEDGTMRNVKHKGEFPRLEGDGTLRIAGDFSSIKISIIAIDRG